MYCRLLSTQQHVLGLTPPRRKKDLVSCRMQHFTLYNNTTHAHSTYLTTQVTLHHKNISVMKLQIATILSCLASSAAFSTSPTFSSNKATSAVLLAAESNSNLSRRQTFASILGTTLALSSAIAAPVQAAREPQAEYLTEPTEAFKESERQRDEFRRQQLGQKRKFTTVLDRFTFESKTPESFVDDLKELRSLVIQTEGMPAGIKKDELVKIIRAKKAKGLWPTDVEYNYQALIREIAYQQSPNRDKDIDNPL